MVVSDRRFVFSNLEKCIVLWATKICWVYSPNKRLQKEKLSRRHFKKISQTLQNFSIHLFIFSFNLHFLHNNFSNLCTLIVPKHYFTMTCTKLDLLMLYAVLICCTYFYSNTEILKPIFDL